MKLKVEHITSFRYDAPVHETATEVRLQPAHQSEGLQQVESFRLEIEPATEIFSYNDYFGNIVHHFSLLQKHDNLLITAVSIVSTTAAPVPPTPQELISLYDFQAASPYIIFSPGAIEYAARFDAEAAQQRPYEVTEQVCRTINTEFAYRKGVTAVDSTVAEVLEHKSGVCQDFAHVMITICRALGLASRYVSGYLYAGEGDEDDEQVGASHAWTEVFCGADKGWVAFDPTHRNLLADERYIKIGVGRDYSDVAPVRGTYRGSGHETLSVAVRVSAV
jgi:transglutaminase-like putative cysteine protease